MAVGNKTAEKDYALCVAVTDDIVAVGYNSGKVSVYQNTMDKELLVSWKAHASSVRSLCFVKSDSEYKKDLVTASDDHQVTQWRLTGNVQAAARSFKGHSDGVTCVRAKEAFVITSSKDSTVRVWNAIEFSSDGESDNDDDSSESVATLHGHTGIVTCCDLSSCETKALSCGYDRVCCFYRVQSCSYTVFVSV